MLKQLKHKWTYYCNDMKQLLQHEIETTKTYCNISKKIVLLQHWDEEVETLRNVLLQQQKNNSWKTLLARAAKTLWIYYYNNT
jgi:hypothetical protein